MELVSVTSVLVVGVVSLLIFFVWRSLQTLKTFQRLGIPGPRPIPFVGNTLTMMKRGFAVVLPEWEKQYGKVYGIYFPMTPSVVVFDLDMVREVMVKRFAHFANRMPETMLDFKPWSDNLLQLRDDHWKHVRAQLSPTFSSGKLKKMMQVLDRVVGNLDQHVKGLADSGEAVELKGLCGCFAMDSVAGAAFGMDVNSLTNPDDVFIKCCRKVLKQNVWLMPLMLMFPFLGPVLHRLFGFSVLDAKATQHLLDVLDQALKDRRQDSKKHSDFLQMLVDAEKEGEEQGPVDTEIDHSVHLATSQHWTRKGLTEGEIKANALVFLLAGYDTTSTVMSFTLFMLAANKDILHKAQTEIDDKLGQDAVTYESASELTYLDMCVNEAVRMFPPGFILDREAAEDLELGGYRVEKGMRILVPAWAIHMDPQYWPEPDKFDPERHTPEARATRHPFSFLPFGMGPRNCIGMRLAQLEIRMAIATLLQHYNPVLCDKSVYPPKMKPPQLQMVADDGLWVKFTRRD